MIVLAQARCRHPILDALFSPACLRPGAFAGILAAGALGFAPFSWWLVGVELHADFWSIDDHVIFRFLGAADRLPVADLWGAVVRTTEVGQFGQALRYRPAQFILNAVETVFWGLDAGS